MTTNSKGTLRVISHPGKVKASVKIVSVAASTTGEKGLEHPSQVKESTGLSRVAATSFLQSARDVYA